MRFSERMGYREARSVLQTESIDDALRNSLWNVFDILIWSRPGFLYRQHGRGDIHDFGKTLWALFWKKPADTVPGYAGDIYDEIRTWYFNAHWTEVYDFVEFIVSIRDDNEILVEGLNGILERELSGFRVIDRYVTPVTDEAELSEVQNALEDDQFAGVSAHLKSAVRDLSDRHAPDLRNSIKESILAVESAVRVLTGDDKATLGQALTKLEKSGHLHGALKKGFSALYGYTSDEHGIRHAMIEEPDLSVADAHYFLVSCSAFINYLKAKFATIK